MRICVRKTAWRAEWVAYYPDCKKNYRVACGRNPFQARKRLLSKECSRWYNRHKRMRRVATHMTNGCWKGATGPDWEWNKIFKTSYGPKKSLIGG